MAAFGLHVGLFYAAVTVSVSDLFSDADEDCAVFKEDIINVLVHIISFERESLIRAIVNEIYRKTGASVFTVSHYRGAVVLFQRNLLHRYRASTPFMILNENRNYVVLRIFSIFYTIVFAILIVVMLLIWVFGNVLYDYICGTRDLVSFIHKRTVFTIVILTLLFMIIYRFVPNRKSASFLRQWPGALLAAVAGWSCLHSVLFISATLTIFLIFMVVCPVS